jgi:hypothetical protein
LNILAALARGTVFQARRLAERRACSFSDCTHLAWPAVSGPHKRKQILAAGFDYVLAEERPPVLVLTGDRQATFGGPPRNALNRDAETFSRLSGR